jgi:hypothetical protein
MSEKRKLKCIKLAIKAGATPENAVRIAKDFEQWVGEFSDPLKLDSKSPKVMDCYPLTVRIGSEVLRKLGEQEQEIDWSRPQLVVSTEDPIMIVRTTGWHEGDVFQGFGPEEVDAPEEYKKKWFAYHGEIPQEQPTEENTTGLDFLEAVDALRYNENYMYSPSQSVRLCVNGSMLQHFPNGSTHFYSPSLNHLRATDWQIINK